MKKTKRIISLLLAIIMMFSLSSISVFAKEAETEPKLTASSVPHWSAGNTYYAEYTFTDNNLTPYKVIDSGTSLLVTGEFRRADASNSQIRLTFQVRDYDTGEILSSTTATDLKNDGVNTNEFVGAFITVHSGQRIQFFLDASSISNPPGYYRSAFVKYSASLR